MRKVGLKGCFKRWTRFDREGTKIHGEVFRIKSKCY